MGMTANGVIKAKVPPVASSDECLFLITWLRRAAVKEKNPLDHPG